VFPMSYLNSAPASSDVYLWSLAPVLVPPGYDNILGTVKDQRTNPRAKPLPGVVPQLGSDRRERSYPLRRCRGHRHRCPRRR
jgi:hypothetical protein